MARRPNPTAVGLFVLASLILIVSAVLVFGSRRFFRARYQFVCFFQGDLNGLKIGAAVKFRGVPIGTVTKIRLGLDPEEGTVRAGVTGIHLPVIFELDQNQLVAKGITAGMLQPAIFDELIKHGLRAQLAVESILTGLLYIDLDLHPDAAQPNLVLQPGSSSYQEIPTVPTTIEQVQQGAMRALAKLDQIDFAGMVRSITDASSSIKDFAGSQSLRSAIDSLTLAAGSMGKASIAIRDAANNFNTKIDPTVASLQKTSEEVDQAMRQVTATLNNVQTTIAPDSPVTYQLTATLKEMSEASRSLRDLTDYLQRNPSALVRGKYIQNGER
jgi:phospholipid/cholesterol/gamma-HCH transport system substrate-binding protein